MDFCCGVVNNELRPELEQVESVDLCVSCTESHKKNTCAPLEACCCGSCSVTKLELKTDNLNNVQGCFQCQSREGRGTAGLCILCSYALATKEEPKAYVMCKVCCCTNLYAYGLYDAVRKKRTRVLSSAVFLALPSFENSMFKD